LEHDELVIQLLPISLKGRQFPPIRSLDPPKKKTTEEELLEQITDLSLRLSEARGEMKFVHHSFLVLRMNVAHLSTYFANIGLNAMG
jgi:hypothetical protein